MVLVPCDGCGRHIRDDDGVCPFCTRGRPRVTRAMHLIGGALTTVVLAACYGVGGFETDEEYDADGDGTPAAWDCDDNDASINPEAPEICDDAVDNDCDGLQDLDDPDCVDTDM